MCAHIVIFDIGGVLIDWNPAYLYRQLLPDETSVTQFLTEVCTGAWNEQFDGGMLFADGIAVVVSGREGLKKPDTAIFKVFLERAGVAAGDCLFIDDNPLNVAAATSLGFQTELFRTAEALEQRLVDMGLLLQIGKPVHEYR